jgi:hypothetical protein
MRKKSRIISVKNLLDRVNDNKTGIFSRIPEVIVILDSRLAKLIGDDYVHISEFVIAKVKGLIHGFNGHSEITDQIFEKLPWNINNPKEIIVDKRIVGKYLFVAKDPTHVIVIEVTRKESGKTEINTIYPIGEKERRRLDKYPIAFSSISGGTPTPSYMPRQ